MLLSLNISNFAVFEKESVRFEKGFNVFTGETGAGKSILIEALNIILGERASKDLIRKGKKSALIEAVFEIDDVNRSLYNFLKENDIVPEDEDGDLLIISREILESGKSINKVNSKVVPLNIIKSMGRYLINIYGQFGHENLFKKENHIVLLDDMCKEELSPQMEQYRRLYKNCSSIENEIAFLEEKLVNRETKIEQLRYEIDEIDGAGLNEPEEETLLSEIKKLTNIQEIKKAIYDINNLINHDDSSAINNLNRVYSILSKIMNYDESTGEFFPKIDLLLEEMQDLIYDIDRYSESLEIDEERLSIIENRVALINRLKRKYGFSIEKILEYRKNSYEELTLLIDAEAKLKSLLLKHKSLKSELLKCGDSISTIRKKAANVLETDLLRELKDLNMKNIKFKVSITRNQEFTEDGLDSVEFLISTNVGSDLNSVQKIVSGGEASRIMLALKKIMSDRDTVETLVFDEIDSGISGKTAQMAGIKMKFISGSHQIICITHSPQIASIAKNHFFIEKKIIDNNTYSKIKKLDDDNKVHEIARLLSGIKITETSLNNALELIKFSNNIQIIE